VHVCRANLEVTENSPFFSAKQVAIVCTGGTYDPSVNLSILFATNNRLAPNVTVMETGFPYFVPFFSKDEGHKANGQMPGWQLTGSDFFKGGGLDFTLENGVPKGSINNNF
jgi:hypothetical protein